MSDAPSHSSGLWRHVNLCQVAVATLLRRPRKTLAIALPMVVAMGVASAITVIKDGLARDAVLCAEMLPDITVQRVIAGRPERLSADVLRSLERLPGVRKVAPRAWGYVPVRVQSSDLAYSLIGLDLSRTPVPRELGLVVRQGRFLEPGDSRRAVVGEAFLRAHSAQVGQQLILTDPFGYDFALEIVGAFVAEVQIYTADAVITTIDTAREFFGLQPDEASDLCVHVESSASIDQVAQAIVETDATLRAVTRDGLTELTVSAFGRRAGMLQLIWMVLLLTVTLIAWAETSSVSQEERREIGTLKAVGWDTGDVLETKCVESVVTGLVATLFGLVLGLAYVHLGAPGIKGYFLGWACVYPEFPVPMYVSSMGVVLLLAVGVLPLLASTIVPAWLASITDPDEAIRA